jgi:uncharacterized protein YjbI with pentapeptide repeats
MRARLYSWWQKKTKPLDAVITSFITVLITLTILSILGYLFHWDWTGLPQYTSPPHPNNINFLPGKTLWDWLQLLIIPAVLAIGGYLFNYTASRNEREATKQRDQTERDIASDNQCEAALQAYIDKISELLLEKHLRESKPADEVRTIARVRTLTTLARLDQIRKGSIVQFLHESQLIDSDNTIVTLEGANLSEINLSGANLSEINLSKANLSGANLSGANLIEANLIEANLSGANLYRATLDGTNLYKADLSSADLSSARLNGANLHSAVLIGSDLGSTNLKRADLRGADLRGAILDIGNPKGPILGQSDLRGAILDGAYLEEP